MYRNLSSFLQNHLSQLIAGKSRLRVMVASYNSYIGRHTSGPVTTGDPSLSVTVHTADRQWSGRSKVLPVNEMADILTDTNGMHGIIAQQQLEEMFTMPHLEEGDSALVFVYAGRPPQFYDAVDFAVRLKRENPTIDVCVVSCTCRIEEKGHRLVWAMEEDEDGNGKEIAFAIEVDDCGAGTSMNTIIERLIEIWPQREV